MCIIMFFFSENSIHPPYQPNLLDAVLTDWDMKAALVLLFRETRRDTNLL